jgi:hypothetical protein
MEDPSNRKARRAGLLDEGLNCAINSWKIRSQHFCTTTNGSACRA